VAERYHRDFTSFWDFYVSQHMKPGTRNLHWIGSTLGLVCLFMLFWMTAIFPLNLLWIPAGFILGYGFAWVSHFFIEKNKPATFLYPAWSFAGDWKMWWLMTTGRMDAHVARVKDKMDDGWVVGADRFAPVDGTAA